MRRISNKIKRKWFFWFDRLKISRAERFSMLSLISLSLLLTVFGWFFDPHPSYNDEHYQELDRFFTRRFDSIQAREARIKARYKGEFPKSERVERQNGLNKINTLDSKKVDINKADFNALQTLPGIGPALAERIILFRERKGPFEHAGDLVQVKGIGSVTLKKIRPLLHLSDPPEK